MKLLWQTLLQSGRLFKLRYSLPRTTWQTLALLSGLKAGKDDRLTAVTCSISQDFVRLWLYFAKSFLNKEKWRYIILDSSGDINPQTVPDAEVIRIYNMRHGAKIDIAILRIIRSKLVFLCDDDKYLITDPASAFNHFTDPTVAAVSLCRREWYRWKIKNEEHWPMGSYSLLFNRNIFLENNLTFKPFPNRIAHNRVFIDPDSKQTAVYDTGDHANEQLLLMGRRVITYPEGDFILGFHSLSSSKILLLMNKKEDIMSALLSARHYHGLNGMTLFSLYSLTKFEQLFRKVFNEQPQFSSGLASGDLIAIINRNSIISSGEKEMVYRHFAAIDSVTRRLEEYIIVINGRFRK